MLYVKFSLVFILFLICSFFFLAFVFPWLQTAFISFVMLVCMFCLFHSYHICCVMFVCKIWTKWEQNLRRKKIITNKIHIKWLRVRSFLFYDFPLIENYVHFLRLFILNLISLLCVFIIHKCIWLDVFFFFFSLDLWKKIAFWFGIKWLFVYDFVQVKLYAYRRETNENNDHISHIL